MSFLDSLENSLKALESREERDPVSDKRRVEEEAAIAPWAEKLKTSAFTTALLSEAAGEAQRRRAKLYLAWIGPALRLELKNRKLDLCPRPDGITAVFQRDNIEVERLPLRLDSAPAELLRHWLA